MIKGFLALFVLSLFVGLTDVCAQGISNAFNGGEPLVGNYISSDSEGGETTTTTVPFGPFDVHVLDSSGGDISSVRVYLFTIAGQYTGRNCLTGATGRCTITPTVEGDFKVRVDAFGGQYWSADFHVPSVAEQEVVIPTRTLFRVTESGGVPVSGGRAYLFTQAGVYAGVNCLTNSSGECLISPRTTGVFKIRFDVYGGQYWSGEFTVPEDLVEMSIPSRTLVRVTESGGVPVSGGRAYLFTQAGVYAGVNCLTNSSGECLISPRTTGVFKIRFDVYGGQYWSGEFTVPEDLVEMSIPSRTLLTAKDNSGNPIMGVRGYLFTSSGTYASVNCVTNSSGQCLISPRSLGDFKIRLDTYGTQIYSDDFTAPKDEVQITVPVVVVHVQNSTLDSLTNVRVYVFTSAGTYLSVTGLTDTSGNVNLTTKYPGSYKFRADYQGQHWSDTISVPPTYQTTVTTS